MNMRISWSVVGVFAVMAFALSLWLSVNVFHRAPLTTDELSYLFQAQLFSEGQLKREAPPFREAFLFPMIIQREEAGWFSRYPPGHAVWLTPGIWLGDPYLMIAWAAALGVWITARVGARLGLPPALLAGMLLISPFYVFTHGTLLSHTSGYLATALMVLAYIAWRQSGALRWAVAAGLAWGWIFHNRTYTALLIAVPFAVHSLILLARARDRKTLEGTLAFAGSALLGIVTLLGYNYLMVGDPFTMTYLYYNPSEGLGFGRRNYLMVTTHHPSPVEHTFTKGLSDLWTNVRLLDRWLWGFRGTAMAWAALAMIGWNRRWSPLFLAAAIMVPLGYVFFWYPGWNVTGPNYYVEVLPFIMITAGFGVYRVGNLLPRRSIVRWSAALLLMILMLFLSSDHRASEIRSLRRATDRLGRYLEFIQTIPPGKLVMVDDRQVGVLWAGGLNFNPRGLEGPSILTRSLGEADISVMRYFSEYEPYYLRRRRDGFRLDPADPPEPLNAEFHLPSVHRLTGANVPDPDDNRRVIRVARADEHEAGWLLFGRYLHIYPGEFAVEFIIDAEPREPGSGRAVARLDVASGRGAEIRAEMEIEQASADEPIVLRFRTDSFTEIEPRIDYLRQGDIQVHRVAIREIIGNNPEIK